MSSWDNLIPSFETHPFRPQLNTSFTSQPFNNETQIVSKPQRVRNANPKISKRKSRVSKRTPTTFIAADPENFRQMVQHVTGVRFTAGSCPVKVEPQRPVQSVNRLQVGSFLPTLDTSAFLLDHHQQVVGPDVVEFGPVGEGCGPAVDLDGFCGFPTLESTWKVM